MPRRMSRGKQQVLLSYLPERTFDFEKIGTIARVDRIRGFPRTDLNLSLVLRAIQEQLEAWQPPYRPVLVNVADAAERFVLLEPRSVEANMFPLVFWCQSSTCGHVLVRNDGPPSSADCPKCHTRSLRQMRFVRVHRCGALEPLTPPQCSNCHHSRDMSLSTRGSETIAGFQWICRACNNRTRVFAGRCRQCTWPGADRDKANMSIMVHRASATYYPHQVVLLNQPGTEMSAFLATDRWQAVAAGRFLGLPSAMGRRLVDFATLARNTQVAGGNITDVDRVALRASGMTDDQIVQYELMQSIISAGRQTVAQASTPQSIADDLVRDSAVPWSAWSNAGQEMLEAVMPQENGTCHSIDAAGAQGSNEQRALTRLGLAELSLVTEFPITTAVYGYSRVDYQPDECFVSPFPADRDANGRFPIFVNVTSADALLLRLDHRVVLAWLAANGMPVAIPATGNRDLAERSRFVSMFDGVDLRQTISAGLPQARMVFGLVHTLSHAALRHAGLLCGLDPTSLAEYVLPRALSVAIYSNQSFGATIGALTALFEQSLEDWLGRILATRRCLYDPVCAVDGGACHACAHASETSCRFFNVNLGRQFLFGGPDPVLGQVSVGFADFVRQSTQAGG
jgi:ribosomal protein L40E